MSAPTAFGVEQEPAVELTDPPQDAVPDTVPPDVDTCQVCGKPLEYGGRGRHPTRCDEHKRQRTAGTAQRRPNLDNLHRQLAGTFYGVGKAVEVFEPYDGMVIQNGTMPLTDALTNVAANDPKVRRYLESAMASMGWGQVVMALAAIVGPILAHHNMFKPTSRIGQMYAGPVNGSRPAYDPFATGE